MALVKPRSTSEIAKIKVVGVGGGGGNAIAHMIENDNINGVEFIIANTDAQALLTSPAETKVQLGEKLTRGLGAGGDPTIGQKAAEESREKLKDLLKGSDMVFVAGGMGGGTASGAAPIIGEIAKDELDILTIGVVTKPFMFEGTRRMVIAEEAIDKLKKKLDTVIVVPNQKLLDLADTKKTLLEAFDLADSVLTEGVKGISELITTPGLINLDFADIQSIMKDAGSALLGIGRGSGENRAEQAVNEAISSRLLDVTIEGARGILFNITGGNDLTMSEVEQAAQEISKQVGGDANIIFGATIDESMQGVKMTVIATGFDETRKALSELMKPRKQKRAEPKKEVKEKEKKEDEDLPFSKEELPEGVEIENEFDIPSFLRKKS